MGEQVFYKHQVTGSTPVTPTRKQTGVDLCCFKRVQLFKPKGGVITSNKRERDTQEQDRWGRPEARSK